MKLLLTGFEPFLNNKTNPTEMIVNELHGQFINDYQIIGEILRVEFNISGKQFIKLLKKHEPDAIISLGLAAGRDRITPERIAINCNDGPVDNLGYKPNGERIFEHGPDGYFSKLPIYEIVESLKNMDYQQKYQIQQVLIFVIISCIMVYIILRRMDEKCLLALFIYQHLIS